MKNSRVKIKKILLAALVVFGIAGQTIASLTITANAAPPESISVTNSFGTANCRPQLAITNAAIIPTGLLDAMFNSSDQSINDDYTSITGAQGDGEPIIIMNFIPVDAGNNGTNFLVCDQYNMVSRPSYPITFLGWSATDGRFVNATLNATTQSLTIASGAIRGSGSTVLTVTNDPDSGNALANPIFGPGGGSVGFCSAYASQGYLVDAYNACMQVSVVDFNTMRYREETYTLVSWRGDNMIYKLSDSPYDSRQFFIGQSDSCKPELRIGTGNDDSNGDTFDLNVDNNNAGEFRSVMDALTNLPSTATIGFRDYSATCADLGQVDIAANNFQNLRVMFQVFPKENSIVFRTNNPSGNEERFITGTFTQDAANPRQYNAPARDPDCSSPDVIPRIVLGADPVETANADPVSATWYFTTDTGNCEVASATVLVKQTPASSTETAASLGASTGVITDGGTDTAAVPEKTCSSEGGGLGWIVCPVLVALDEATQWLEGQLRQFLFVDPGQFDRNGDGAALYRTWSTFRGLATVLIVIIALIMIFSQAMGDGIFDNYSIKKLLPRLLIAGIGIQLSWFLMTELVNVFNILGNGISGLIMSPFTYINEGGTQTSITVETNLREILPTSTAGGQGLMAGIVIAGGIALMGAAGALAIGAVAALFVGFITLIVRNMIIFLAVIFAPLAIAMSVLPGTQKTSKWWWESFEKALLMYPIVMVLLAAGKIVSNILMTSGPENAGLDAVTTIAAIVAWYAPFFFLPKALQAGGQALGKISGLAGDRSKGMFDKARGWNDSYKKNKDTRRTRNAFENQGKRERFDPRRLTDAKTRGGAFLAAGAIGRGSRFERENLQVNAAKESAQRRLFNKDQALTEVKAQEAKVAAQRADLDLQSASVAGSLTYTDRAGAKQTIPQFQYGNKNNLEAIVRNSADKAQVQAALSRLNTLGADDTVRRINQDYEAGALSGGFADGSTLSQTFGEHKLSGDYVGAFKDKAPDLYKPEAFKDSKADAMVNWTDGTMNEAVRQLQDMRSSATASGDVAKMAEADDAWARFGQSIHQITNDPKLSGRMSNGTLAAISSNNATIVRELGTTASLNPTQQADYAASIGRIQQNGTIQ